MFCAVLIYQLLLNDGCVEVYCTLCFFKGWGGGGLGCSHLLTARLCIKIHEANSSESCEPVYPSGKVVGW